MVLMDDGEARGFLFGYDKLLGASAHGRRRQERPRGQRNVCRPYTPPILCDLQSRSIKLSACSLFS